MRPRSLVFDLYGEYFRYTGGAVKLGALTELMGVFGVESATVRVVMARLRKEGWFDSVKAGREVTYSLNEQSWKLLDDGRSRIFERLGGVWDRTWTQVLVDHTDLERDGRKRIETALTWWGFGQYGQAAWFSPHDREKQLREALTGDDELGIQFLRSRTSGLADDRFIAERCWDLADLGDEYQEFIRLHTPRKAQYRRGMTGREALLERMKLVRTYRRFPFLDPDLPEPLLPPRWRGSLAHELFIECHDELRSEAEAFVRSTQGLATDEPR